MGKVLRDLKFLTHFVRPRDWGSNDWTELKMISGQDDRALNRLEQSRKWYERFRLHGVTGFIYEDVCEVVSLYSHGHNDPGHTESAGHDPVFFDRLAVDFLELSQHLLPV